MFVFLSIEKGKLSPVEAASLTRELLETNKCYLLDCGVEAFVWTGRNTSLEERKSASAAAEVRAGAAIENFLSRYLCEKFISYVLIYAGIAPWI